MRACIARSVVAASLLSAALPRVALAKPRPQQVCGIVVAVPCRPTDPAVITLLVQPGAAVDVEASTDADAATLRSAAGPLFFQEACVTGTLVARQNAERAGRLVVDASGGLTAHGPAPADWTPTDLHTACEADVIAARPLKHQVEISAREAIENGVHGTALFQVIIAADGSLENLRLVKSLDAIHGTDLRAADYVRGTTYVAATKAGVPVRFTMLYTFQLSTR